MDPAPSWVIPLAEVRDEDARRVGGKAARLAELTRAGFRVPRGVCVTTAAYERFVDAADLARVVAMELGRKPMSDMRWEEIWDAALRIRNAYLVAPVPPGIADAIAEALRALGTATPVAVRSSAIDEDTAGRSFAGLHESVVGIAGLEAVLKAVRVVWASLWSDAALLYRHELGLDPRTSRMAVVIQELVAHDRAGVAFARDPRAPAADRAVVEAVAGPCADLVDGTVDPDHWELARSSGAVLSWRQGERPPGMAADPLLEPDDLRGILGALHGVELTFGWAPDVEWTGRGDTLTLLQARPITTGAPADDTRTRYLELRPTRSRLERLAARVAGELIPALEAEAGRLVVDRLDELDDGALAEAIEARHTVLERWKTVYAEEFIPLAHGVRELGRYYNDAVRPKDPYEFVGLLRGERLLAARRNAAIAGLAAHVRSRPRLRDALERAVRELAAGENAWMRTQGVIDTVEGGQEFTQTFGHVLSEFLDVAYDGERLVDHPSWLLRTVLELATLAPGSLGDRGSQRIEDGTSASAGTLERRLIEAVGATREPEARRAIALGRLSWRLRDDDNVLLGRLEAELLRAVAIGIARLRATGRVRGDRHVVATDAPGVVTALRIDFAPALDLGVGAPRAGELTTPLRDGRPRQLVGQPAGPGLATGRARIVRVAADLPGFRAGEVLVCDAIQPTMTHLVPLAAAIVERRGGMLIHGAIIARELGIPCVNGVADAVTAVTDGELLTVDGHLGLVIVGPPELDLERRS